MECFDDISMLKHENEEDNEFNNEEEDILNLLEILEKGSKNTLKNENNKISKKEKTIILDNNKCENNNIKNSSNKLLKFDKKDVRKHLKHFFSKAYVIIIKDNYDRIIKEDEDEDSDDEIKYIKKLLKQIILEKNKDNCKMSFKYQNEQQTFDNRNFFLNNFDVIHKIQKFNGLLKIAIIFNVEIKMSIRSGNSLISFSKITLNYEKDNKEIKIYPNFTCNLINNNLGNYSITYCTCGNCSNCKNRKNPFPFDELLNYLREQNNILYKPEYSQLWFGKYNSYRNESNYNCSFCTEFKAKKLNIVKLYCIDDKDHSCIFWICLSCFRKKKRIRNDELCPNCQKFKINFSTLKSIFSHK